LAGIVVVAVAILGLTWRFAPWKGDAATSPEFRRLTFDLAELGVARFTPDGTSVVYSAGKHPHKATIFTQRFGAPGPRQLETGDARLVAISPQSELAVIGEGPDDSPHSPHQAAVGILGRVPLEGGTARELLPQTESADWSPSGQLAVVRRIGEKSRLEFPAGKVLYETAGSIETPRFSPSGDSIAFLDHPVSHDDRGSVAIVDLNGNKRTLSMFWESLRGLAWSPHGDEVWFAAARSGVLRALYAVTLNRRERRVLSVAGGLSLRDISREGDVLLTRDSERIGILFMGPEGTEPRDLSWKDWSTAVDISADGKRILFGEEGEDSGPSYQVGLRSTDGSAPAILGSGVAQSLSPDGKWALSTMPTPNDQIVLLPTGPGSSKTLERGSVEHYHYAGARWFPDSKQIVFVGTETGHGPRCYVQSVEGGKPRAFTKDGMVMCLVSPSGRILEYNEDSRGLLFRSPSSELPEKEFKFAHGEVPSGWTADGRFLYLTQTEQEPMTVTRFEIETGRNTLWRKLPSPPTRAVPESEYVVITPDGQSYAFCYSDHSSDLYVVTGLK
jgi:Tol biopolymer transport system component